MTNHKVPGFYVNRILACPAGWYAGMVDMEGWLYYLQLYCLRKDCHTRER